MRAPRASSAFFLLFSLLACAHNAQESWPRPPPVTRGPSRGASRWERFAPPLYGACDERNGPCPRRVLRVELRWDTAGTDLDLHGVLTQWGLSEQGWFTIADSHWDVPAPRGMFSGTHRLLGDVTDAGDAPEVLEAHSTGTGALLVAVHFHTDRARAGRSTATVDFVCDRHRYARVTRTLESGSQGERSNDFWQVARVSLTGGQGCSVVPVDAVSTASEVDLWHYSRTRR